MSNHMFGNYIDFTFRSPRKIIEVGVKTVTKASFTVNELLMNCYARNLEIDLK